MYQINTQADTFKPTPAMVVWMDEAAENTTSSVADVSRKCNISRQSWYRWIKDEEFRLWFKEEWEKRLSLLSFKLDIIGLQKASDDFRYWEAMQRRIGSLDSDRRMSVGANESLIVYRPERNKNSEKRIL